MKAHQTALVWFRRDLRLTDNPALLHALANAERVAPLFVFAPDEEQPWATGAASRWWLHHSLAALAERLRQLGSRLVVQRGPSQAALLFEPGTILNGQKLPYRVFTPFWRTVEKALPSLAVPRKAPRKLPAVPRKLTGIEIADLQLLPTIAWDQGLAETWTPGEAGALKQLEQFTKQVASYPSGRDRPDRPQTSRLSPHLHFGDIGPGQIVAALRHSSAGAAQSRGVDSYLRQVGWREFAHHLLFHFPQTTDAPLDARFAKQKWRRSRADLRAWQRGATGIPLVDAGMRELWRVAGEALRSSTQLHPTVAAGARAFAGSMDSPTLGCPRRSFATGGRRARRDLSKTRARFAGIPPSRASGLFPTALMI
ncbi:MAG TPA: deoxyribodipyrimidine photo-lyase [Steroidobacter sp.]